MGCISLLKNRILKATLFAAVLSAAAWMFMAGERHFAVYASPVLDPQADVTSTTAVNMKENGWVFSTYVDRDNHTYASVTGFDGNALTLTVPDTLGGFSVKTIGREAFCGNRYLTSVTVPEGVTEIGRYAFQGCIGLSEIVVPSTMKSIGEGAFYNCFSLKEIDLSANVTRIGSYAFYNCRHLRRASLSQGLKSIGDGAFDGCTLLEDITLGESLESIGCMAFHGCSSLTALQLPEPLKTLGAGAFLNCQSLKKATLGNNLQELQSDTFRGCDALEMISLESVKNIGASCFEGCRSLRAVQIGDSVTEIGAMAFHRCDHLASVTLGSGVAQIGLCAFNGCEALAEWQVSDNNPSFSSINGGLYSKNGEALIFYPRAVEGQAHIGKATRQIKDYALLGCDKLSGVVLPDSLTEIGTAAFMNCTNITEISVPDQMEKLGSLPFGFYLRDGILHSEPYLDIYGASGETAELYCAAHEIAFTPYENTWQLSSEHVVLSPGESFSVKAAFFGGKKAAVTWESSDSSVVDVRQGKLTAQSEGSAAVTASAEGFTPAVIRVDVVPAEESTEKPQKKYDSRTLYCGETEELSSIFDQIIDPLLDSDKFWYSSNPAVASVSAEGRVKAHSAGNATIICHLPNGSENHFIFTVIKKPCVLSLEAPSSEMAVGESITLHAGLLPAKSMDTLTWKSDNPGIASVNDDGLVTAVSQGSCEITATTANGIKSSVTVNCVIPASRISLNTATRSVYQGKEFTLEATLSPDHSERTIIWTSSDPTVASVNSKGKVRGVSFGTAVIFAATDDGIVTSCEVTVIAKAELLRMEQKKLTLNAGDRQPLGVTVYPSYSPETTDRCLWNSTNENVATVDENGVVTAVGVGNCIINCKTAGDLISKCQIYVRQPAEAVEITGSTDELYEGEVVVLSVGLTPENTTDQVEWLSSDENVAYVTSTGSVKGKSAGTADITVKVTNDVTGQSITASYTVTVRKKATSVRLKKTSLSLNAGETDSLMYNIAPADSNDPVRWYSSDEKVASVRSDGLITAIGPGSCYIYVETGSGCTDKCRVTVNEKAAGNIA